MKSRFSSQIPLTNRTFELLPIFHTSDAFASRNYIENKEIVAADRCELFNERITYFFYGRPSYKYSLPDESTTNISLYPVSFIMKVDQSVPIKRLFPFDTGAFHNKLFRRFVHPKMQVIEFELENSVNRIHDVVMHFFGSNKNYVLYRGRESKIQASHFEAESYKRMIDGHVTSESDERRITIEIQSDERVSLGADSLLGIICPTQLRDDPLFRQFAKNRKIKIQSYDVEVWNPSQSFGLVAAAAKRFLLKNGYIK